jgi:tetratricopeptide (TPR) repeat protein
VGRHEEAEASARAALTLAARLPPGRGLVAAYTWSAVLLMFSNDNPGARAAGERAVALAERFDEPALQARALNAVGMAHRFIDPEVSEQTMARGLDLARHAGDDTVLGVTLVNRGVGPAEARRYATAERWLREAIDWCIGHDMDGYRAYATSWLARVHFERGDWRQAIETIEAAPPPSRLPARIVTTTVLGRIQARRGDPRAEQTLQDAWTLATQTELLQRLWPAAAGRAELAWLRGEPTAPHVLETYGLAVRMNHPWAIGELAQWVDAPADHGGAAAPYRLPPLEKAQAWDAIGCPYEAAMALAETPEHRPEAVARLERLGAGPVADRLAARRAPGLHAVTEVGRIQ